MTSCQSFGLRKEREVEDVMPMLRRWVHRTSAVMAFPLIEIPFCCSRVFQKRFRMCFQSKSPVRSSRPHMVLKRGREPRMMNSGDVLSSSL
jgi:hypothetical protein